MLPTVDQRTRVNDGNEYPSARVPSDSYQYTMLKKIQQLLLLIVPGSIVCGDRNGDYCIQHRPLLGRWLGLGDDTSGVRTTGAAVRYLV